MNVSKISKFIPIASVVFIFFAFSNSAFAAYTYSRTPTGDTPTSPITISVSFDNLETDFGFSSAVDNWSLYLDTLNPETNSYYTTECINLPTKSGQLVADIPIGSEVVGVFIGAGEEQYNTCADEVFQFEGEPRENTPAFTITAPTSPLIKSGILFGRSGESQEMIQSGGSALASVGFVSSDTFSGIFPYLMLSVGVFIGFYIIQQIVMTIGLKMNPNKVKIDPEQAKWSGRDKIKHEVNEFKKKRRSRIKRGLE